MPSLCRYWAPWGVSLGLCSVWSQAGVPLATPPSPGPVRSGAAASESAAESAQSGAEPSGSLLLALDATLGIGSGRGFLGAGFELLPLQLFSLHGGLGLASGGLTLAAGARLRVLRRRLGALGLGAGWSMSSYTHMVDNTIFATKKFPATYHFERAQFMNLDWFGEWLLLPHIVLRLVLGAGVVANTADAVWVNTSCQRAPCGTPPLVVPYFAFEVAQPVL